MAAIDLEEALREILDLTASGNPDAFELIGDIQTIAKRAVEDEALEWMANL